MKAILFNGMYSGRYIIDHLGHEVINLFASDNGEHYVYINPLGKIAQDYDIECILLGELVKDGKFKVIAKATGLTMLQSTRKITKETNVTSLQPLSPEHKKDHLDELKGVSYADVPIDQLFDEETQILATFKATEVVMAAEETYIYAYNYGEDVAGKLPASNHDGVKPFKFSRTSPYMYFPEKNKNGEPMDDYKKLHKIIDKIKWEGKNVGKFDPRHIYNLPTLSMIETMGKEDSELAYSNMIYYWLNRDKEILKDFVNEVLKAKDRSIPLPADDITIERETENIDLLISYGSTRIIIENKIKADISVYTGRRYPNQLVRYKEEQRNKKGATDVHCFLLSPDYRNIVINDYDKDYIQLKYSDLYRHFTEVDTDNIAALDTERCTLRSLFGEFCRSLELHTATTDNRNYYNMIRNFEKVISRKSTN